MIELIKMSIEMSNLRMENARLKAKLAESKAMKREMGVDVEKEILDRIRAIKCRDEIPNNIFLGRLEWDALKAMAGNPMYCGPNEAITGRYNGYTVVRVNKATFVDVSTVQ